jgi:hypothetical protein
MYVLRRQHDNGKATGDVVDWRDGSFNLHVTVGDDVKKEASYRGHDVDGAKAACDAFVVQEHPHPCSDEACGRWTRIP